MMVDETRRDSRRGADGTHRQALVAVTLQALDGGEDQRLAPRRGQLPPEPRTLRAALARGHATRRSRPRRKSVRISRAALCPGAPLTPPPGWVPAPHMYRPGSGPR